MYSHLFYLIITLLILKDATDVTHRTNVHWLGTRTAYLKILDGRRLMRWSKVRDFNDLNLCHIANVQKNVGANVPIFDP